MAAGGTIWKLLERKTTQLHSPTLARRLNAGLRAVALLGAGVSALLSSPAAAASASGEAEHGLAGCPWPHRGVLGSHADHSSSRRVPEVYQQVCSSCHSMSLTSYRDLVGVSCSEDETKAMAAEIEVVDEPNEKEETYANEQSQRFSKGGASPPEFSLSTKAKTQLNGQNYVFALLKGYRYPTAGVTIQQAMHCNLHFPGILRRSTVPVSDGQRCCSFLDMGCSRTGNGREEAGRLLPTSEMAGLEILQAVN